MLALILVLRFVVVGTLLLQEGRREKPKIKSPIRHSWYRFFSDHPILEARLAHPLNPLLTDQIYSSITFFKILFCCTA